MGAFDDLVPANKGSKFADLIPKAQPTPEQLARQTYDAAPSGMKAWISAGAEFDSLLRGAKQLVTPDDSTSGKRLTAEADASAPFQNAPHGIENIVGRAMPYVATLPLGGPEAAGARTLMAAGEGAAIGGLQQTGTGDSRLRNAAVGGGLALAGNVAGRGLSKYGNAAAQAALEKAKGAASEGGRALWSLAKAHGINLTPSQVTDSTAIKTISSALNKIPFSGGAGVTERQQAGMNHAVGQGFGADANKLTDPVMAATKSRLGGIYDAVFGRNGVKLDDKVLNSLGDIQKEAESLTPDHAGVINKQINDILGMSKDGVIPGKAYQAFRVDRLKKLEQSARVSEPFKADLLQRLRTTLQDAANRSMTGDDAALLAETNRQYSNMKVAGKSLKQVEGAKGNIKPSSLWGIVNQRNGSTKEMRDLAILGQHIKDPIADSGTAQRMMVYNALTHAAGLAGGGYAATSDNPLIRDAGLVLGGGVVGGRVLNSSKLARLMMREGVGQTRQVAGHSMQQMAPLLALLLRQQQPTDPNSGP